MFVYVTDHTSDHGRERAAANTGEEASSEHSTIRTSHSATQLAQHEKDTGSNKDGFSSIELGKGGKDHGGNGEAGREGRDADKDGDVTDIPVASHLGGRRTVGAGGICGNEGHCA